MTQQQQIEFEVLGDPKSLKRPKFFRRGKFVGTYDPNKQEKENFISQAFAKRPEKPFEQALSLHITFYFKRPKSHYKKNGELRPDAPLQHVSRPDVDNLIKFVCDSLNGIFWADDSVISNVIADKVYGDVPKMVVSIKTLNSQEVSSVQ
jgi:Holliday junction resolvase RusA-like endonuclease